MIVDELKKGCYDGSAMKGQHRSGWIARLGDGILPSLRWLVPGLGVKRWLLLILLGTTLLGVGLALLILDIYRNAPETWWLPLISTASLRFLPRILRVLIFGAIGVALVVAGIWGLNRSLMAPFVRPGRKVVDAVAGHRRKDRGPRVVVVGGGHGLATLLRGLRHYTSKITAIVTVADDGGSSGKLRKTLGILPPGDIRNCLAALSNDEAMLTQLFKYRFPNGSSGLEGHSFGNLFISALTDITGSFEDAIAESGKVLSVNGRVLPSTLHNVQLVADVALPLVISEVRVEGESQIPESTGAVRRVWLEPNSPPAYPQAIQSILAADLIVIGPGSLYTSLIPNLLVPDIADAIRASRALKLFICNVATQPGETDHYSCYDHLRAVESHAGQGLFDLAVLNNQYAPALPEGIEWVKLEDNSREDYIVYQSDLVDPDYPWRHDEDRLAQALISLLEERTGPLSD